MRNLSRSILFIAAAAILSGCAATVTSGSNGAASTDGVTKASAMATAASRNVVFEVAASADIRDSADFGQIAEALKSAMRAQATQSNALLALPPNDSPPAEGTRVLLTLTDYRMVSAGARFGLGIMTGNAFILANAQYYDVATGKLLGERSYNTTSSAWQGVFAPTTDKQTNAMAATIMREINPR